VSKIVVRTSQSNTPFEESWPEYHISFIYILYIHTGLQNPWGYGNSEMCSEQYKVNVAVKSITIK
jgi:hypothetical protein